VTSGLSLSYLHITSIQEAQSKQSQEEIKEELLAKVLFYW
jgi:hypothetical protein